MLSKNPIVDSFEQLTRLQKDVEEKFVQYQKTLHNFQQALIAQLSHLSGNPLAAQNQPEAPIVRRGPGRPPKVKIEPTEPVLKRGPGRPPKHRQTIVGNKPPQSSESRDFEFVVWQMLGKGTVFYRKSLQEYPSKAVGLKVSELKELIENDESYTGSSENLGVMVQNALYKLREVKKIDRNDDDRRYYIIRGSQFED